MGTSGRNGGRGDFGLAAREHDKQNNHDNEDCHNADVIVDDNTDNKGNGIATANDVDGVVVNGDGKTDDDDGGGNATIKDDKVMMVQTT